jgi:phosphoenolpyruvate synthase/pyruvate phosphate dikinase
MLLLALQLRIYFDADKVVEMKEKENQDCIMVRPFTKPDDVHGMLSAKGILTSEGAQLHMQPLLQDNWRSLCRRCLCYKNRFG